MLERQSMHEHDQLVQIGMDMGNVFPLLVVASVPFAGKGFDLVVPGP